MNEPMISYMNKFLEYLSYLWWNRRRFSFAWL